MPTALSPNPPTGYRDTGPRSVPPAWEPRHAKYAAQPLPRGARVTPPNLLRAVHKAVLAGAAPDNFAVVPARLDSWDNFQYGDCVSAEEAFADACYSPEQFIPKEEVVRWANANGFLNGAYLTEVMDARAQSGFKVGSQEYRTGSYVQVDYTKESQLAIALTKGPLKIAIDADALPRDAGSKQGWYALGGNPGQYRNTDHCVSLSGYGTAQYLYAALGVPLPKGLDPTKRGYLLFTWSTLGFVDLAWLLSTCVECYLRQPTTVGVPPLPGPTPTPEPTPTPTPTPGPFPEYDGVMHTPLGDFPIELKPLQTAIRGMLGAGGNWWVIAADVFKLLGDAARKDLAAVVADLYQLFKDAGIELTDAEAHALASAFQAEAETRCLCSPPRK